MRLGDSESLYSLSGGIALMDFFFAGGDSIES